GLRALTDNVSGTGAQSRAVSFYTAVFGLGASLSILLSGWIAGAMGFRWAFGLGAIGPLAAVLMVALGLPSRKPTPLLRARLRARFRRRAPVVCARGAGHASHVPHHGRFLGADRGSRHAHRWAHPRRGHGGALDARLRRGVPRAARVRSRARCGGRQFEPV